MSGLGDPRGEQQGEDLGTVRQGLRMAAPPDPAKLEAEKQKLRELDAARSASVGSATSSSSGPAIYRAR